MKSSGLDLAKVQMSSQVMGWLEDWDGLVMMGPSKNFSNPFRRRGPCSLAPKLAAKLSCLSKTPIGS